MQVPGGQPLRVVLRAAQRVQVQRLRHRVGQRDLDDLGADAAQQQPLAQHHGVAAVAVGAHHVGQHQPDPHRGFESAMPRQPALQLQERGVVGDDLHPPGRAGRDGRHGVVHQRVLDAGVPEPHRQVGAAFAGGYHWP